MVKSGEQDKEVNAQLLTAIGAFRGKVLRAADRKMCAGREGDYKIPRFGQERHNVTPNVLPRNL